MSELNGGTFLYSVMPSPIGELLLVSDGEALVGLHMTLRHGKPVQAPEPWWKRDDKALGAARAQLREYFAGERQVFDLSLVLAGTPFQQSVWKGLLEIPFGVTWSYAELARRVGRPGASRAVGAANGRNPIGIVVPCHRVIGADGTLTGYGGGVDRKEWLLRHERAEFVEHGLHATGSLSGETQRKASALFPN